jgi:hypothetical protein
VEEGAALMAAEGVAALMAVAEAEAEAVHLRTLITKSCLGRRARSA